MHKKKKEWIYVLKYVRKKKWLKNKKERERMERAKGKSFEYFEKNYNEYGEGI